MFAYIKAFHLFFLGNPKTHANLNYFPENEVGHNAKDGNGKNSDNLDQELFRSPSVEDPYLAVEEAHGTGPPHAVHEVDRDRTHRIIHFYPVETEDTVHNQNACDQPNDD